MSYAKYELDMSQGSIFKNIIKFTFPLMCTNVLQLLYNAADLVVVSRWAGSSAMASVGSTSSITTLLVNLFVSFTLGASVLVSRRYGAHDNEGLSKAVHTSMLISLIAGICACFAGLLLSKPLLVLMKTPEGKILDGAVLYMRIIFMGTPASIICNFGAAILRAVGDTKRPLYIFSISGIANVILNLILVISFNMDVAGVAIATTFSNYLSMFMVLYLLLKTNDAYKLDFKKLKLHKQEFTQIIKIGAPATLQGSVFSIANSLIQSTVNTFGPAAIAGNAAGSNIESFVYMSMNSFYQSTLTCIGHNYGAKNEKRINQTIVIALLCVTVVGVALGSLSVIFSKQLLGFYITDSPEALAFGVRRMIITSLPYFLCGIMEVLTGVLRGLGYSVITAINSFLAVCGFRVLWILFVFPLHKTAEVLFLSWPLSWLVCIAMHLIALHIAKKKLKLKMLNM